MYQELLNKWLKHDGMAWSGGRTASVARAALREFCDWLDRDAEHRRASDHAEQKSALKLPEWYDMAEFFFNEIRVFSTEMYNDLSGESILIQLRYAAEREAKAQISERSAGS